MIPTPALDHVSCFCIGCTVGCKRTGRQGPGHSSGLCEKLLAVDTLPPLDFSLACFPAWEHLPSPTAMGSAVRKGSTFPSACVRWLCQGTGRGCSGTAWCLLCPGLARGFFWPPLIQRAGVPFPSVLNHLAGTPATLASDHSSQRGHLRTLGERDMMQEDSPTC